MTVKHTHPDHKSDEEREEQLRAIQRNCMAILAAMRLAEAQKRSA